MIDQLQHRQLAHGTRGTPRPAGRNLEPSRGAGRRTFLTLLVSGLAINAWALFPFANESGIYVPLPQLSPPAAAETDPTGDGVLTNLPNFPRGGTFRFLAADGWTAGPRVYGPDPYPTAAVIIAMAPLRSKLQALLMLLYSHYGYNMDTLAMQLKLQMLLNLPDAVLAQLIRHPELADLNTMLDGVFLASVDLPGIKAELDKIDVSSTSGPTEQVDLVKINGLPAYVVQSPVDQLSTENAAAMRVLVIPQGADESLVVSEMEAPVPMAAFSVPPSDESYVPPPEPSAPAVVETSAPPEPEPSWTETPPSTGAVTDEQPPEIEADDDETEPADPDVFSDEGDAPSDQQDEPASEETDTHTTDESSSTIDGDGITAGHTDDDGGGSTDSAEPAP